MNKPTLNWFVGTTAELDAFKLLYLNQKSICAASSEETEEENCFKNDLK